MKLSIRPFENIFSVISLILFSQGFFNIIIGSSSSQEKGDVDSIFLRVVFLLIYLLTFALLAFRQQRTLAFLKTHTWIVFLFGLTAASVFWSNVPNIAFRKVVSFVGSSLFGLYLGSRFSFKEQLRLYGWVYGISILFTLLFALGLPEIGVMNTAAIVGAWRGIYPHKNGLGQSMFAAFLTFYFWFGLYSEKKNKLIAIAFCLLSIVIIYFGESATSLISVLFIFGIAEGLKRLSLKSKQSVFLVLLFTLFTCFISFLLIANFEAFLSANSRDITLSGRTPLWATLWEFIQQRPFLGYGYESFFVSQSRESQLLWQVHSWKPPNTHNGYIHIWLHVGLVGLIIFSVGYFGCWFKSLYKYLVAKDLRMLWIFSFLTYTIFFNLTEVSFLATNSNVWIMSLACIYSLKETRVTK